MCLTKLPIGLLLTWKFEVFQVKNFDCQGNVLKDLKNNILNIASASTYTAG